MIAVLAGCASQPGTPSPEAKAQLAPIGTLRVAVLTSNPMKAIEYTAISRLMDDSGKGVWDVAVVAIDPERRSLVDFAPAHLAADGFLTVLVPPGSTARTMADIDRPGMRVAAVRGAAPLMILERTLKNAQVVAAENENAAFALMRDGSAHGYAQNRFMLRARAAQYVAAFVEEAKASGVVQRAIDEAGLQKEVRVAPAEQVRYEAAPNDAM